jgi:hypothetical protein
MSDDPGEKASSPPNQADELAKTVLALLAGLTGKSMPVPSYSSNSIQSVTGEQQDQLRRLIDLLMPNQDESAWYADFINTRRRLFYVRALTLLVLAGSLYYLLHLKGLVPSTSTLLELGACFLIGIAARVLVSLRSFSPSQVD